MHSKCIHIVWIILVYITTSNAKIWNPELSLNPDSTLRPYLIAFVVTDVEKTAQWYKENLGFNITRNLDFPEYDSLKIIFMKMGEVELELIQKNTSFSIKKFVPDYDGFDKAPLIGIAKIAFWIQDVHKFSSSLKTKNVKFLVDIYDDIDFGLKSFIIEDLNGNVLQFNQPITSKQ